MTAHVGRSVFDVPLHVRRVVEEMGGSIEVKTQKGEGSCFTVRFPKAEETT